MRNLLCSYREFYAAKSCTKVYVHIYVCNPQIRHIIHMQQQAVWKDNEKRVLRKIILNRNWSCRRFFWVSGGDIFCFSDLSGQILSARSLWRTYSVYLKRRVLFFFPAWGLQARYSFYTWWTYIYSKRAPSVWKLPLVTVGCRFSPSSQTPGSWLESCHFRHYSVTSGSSCLLKQYD